MKYTIIFGSPRKNGNTAQLLNVFLDTLKDNNNDIDYYDVYESNICGCRACLWCQNDKSKICCSVNDEMQQILQSISASDTIIIASPVYVWSLPAPVKAVIDRMIYSGCKYYGDDPFGPSLYEGKKLAIITTCGYPIDKGADLLEEEMKRFCKHTKMTYHGMLCKRHRNLKEPFMDDNKALSAKEFAMKLINIE